ncbi:MAG: hypothetical protein AUI47_08215 [Acidobacteria bacterium 13_1_40CM_2_68_5]|nr:MAG: hypothetical protein AUI47_08215 [Acidobacteria bacterium 13_1_40CM_2_68_5]
MRPPRLSGSVSETQMIERLMIDQRKLVVTVLVVLLSIMVLLWFIRGPQPAWSNVVFLVISMTLVPLAYLAVYGILYLNVRMNHISQRSLRRACGFLLGGAAIFLTGSTLFAVYQFATHRLLPPPNLLAFGVALGAIKAWGLQATTAVRR